MVLINELTIDEINAALVHLQRSRTEIVGGAKGDTINNILINNTGSGNSVDYSNIIDIIQNRLNAHDKTIENDEKRLEENESLDSTQQEQIESLFAQLEELSNNGIQSLQFDATNRYLIIYTQDGNTYDVEIPSETVTMSFDSTTNKLIFQMGNQTQEVVLPFINTSQMGVAGGVATLDENGRVPYSQLPESAMEFKGEWNASTNTPTLTDGTGTNGDFYICSAGGTVNFGTQAEPRLVTFVVNDRVIYEGDTDQWVKLPAGQVASVNGQSGVVELDADDIPYDATMSVKDKLDSASQADWTETDPTEPSFIKHKIPIWITNGSADDNMSPVDAVTDGEMRPVTSNAVAKAMRGISFSQDGVAGNYFLLAEATNDQASIPYIQANLYLFYHNGGQYRVGTITIDISFKSNQSELLVNGWTDLQLSNSNTRYPAIIVTQDGNKQYLYLQSTDSYFGGWIKIQKYNTFYVTIYDPLQTPSALQGSIIYNSRTDLTGRVKSIANENYIIGEVATGGIYIDGKTIFRRVDTWSLANMPTGNSTHTLSPSYWSNIKDLISFEIIRPATAQGLLFAKVCAGYRYSPATKTLNIYNNSTEWSGPFLIIAEYTKP